MKNPEKVIEILTEKVAQLESELWLARYELEQAKKKIEQLEQMKKQTVVKVDGRLNDKSIKQLKNALEKETRPAAEKAEEMR